MPTTAGRAEEKYKGTGRITKGARTQGAPVVKIPEERETWRSEPDIETRLPLRPFLIYKGLVHWAALLAALGAGDKNWSSGRSAPVNTLGFQLGPLSAMALEVGVNQRQTTSSKEWSQAWNQLPLIAEGDLHIA